MLQSALFFGHYYALQFCPSVCLSQGWISQKRCKLGSPNLHRQLRGRL